MERMRTGTAVAILVLMAMAAPGATGECGRGAFRCGDGSCIPGAWLCDGRAECRDGSDEDPESCDSLSCSPAEFRCGGRRSRCIPALWRCNGHRDCEDGSDEHNCPPRSCTAEELRCGDGSCVSVTFVCDGEEDCADGADEALCPPPGAACGPHGVPCAGAGCVPRLWACDGDADCADGSDEWPERCGAPRAPPPCPPLRFPCRSGECVHARWRCDGSADCADGSDEDGCAAAASCRPDQFGCGDGRCIPALRLCDGESDCADGSDEDGCRNNDTACEGPHRFRCRSGECVPMDRVCDRRRDCRDWSDEPLKECGVNECLEGNGGCSHGCEDLRLGHRCLCPGGFALRPDGRTCDDIDECRDPRSCSQRCRNLPGSFACDCAAGYTLHPETGACLAPRESHPPPGTPIPPFAPQFWWGLERWGVPGFWGALVCATAPPAALLFSTGDGIARLPLPGGSPQILLSPLKHVGGLDADIARGDVFWSDGSRHRIYRWSLANGSEPVAVLETGSAPPDGVAVDWIHGNLYWTESRVGVIGVANADGTRRKTLLRQPGAVPHGIALDPLSGYMYWSDWGARPGIAKGGMDGSDPSALVTEGVEWPSGIALDLAAQRLYWADSRLHALSAVDVDGRRRRTLLADTALLPHPFALTVFQDALFWTDAVSRSVLSVGARTGAEPHVAAEGLRAAQGVVLLHPLRQPHAPRRCPPPGGCPFLCLTAPGSVGFSCACADGLVLRRDGSCAHAPKDTVPTDTTNATTDSTTSATSNDTSATSATSATRASRASAAGNATTGPTDAVGHRTGLRVLAVVLALAVLLPGGALAAAGLWRSWRRRSTNSISFGNPMYQKWGEGGALGWAGGLGRPTHQPVSLEDDVS
ncbi:low-density lipoprotein receptor [Cuculus canorus]|uniref:low-density lipoprotein receptor n=1 Tax=Cuculus canorus TaxID=55661 RepID=UPI0023AA7B0C|nr:low-density lipoprotein receptor [Cuculus canorus]